MFEEALLGKWTYNKQSGSFTESWERISAGHLRGTGMFSKKGRVVFEEELHLIRMKDKWVYVAMPGDKSTAFTQSPDSRSDSMAFVNAEHDFPQQIVYHFAGMDSLVVRVEGEEKGKFRSDMYCFSRE